MGEQIGVRTGPWAVQAEDRPSWAWGLAGAITPSQESTKARASQGCIPDSAHRLGKLSAAQIMSHSPGLEPRGCLGVCRQAAAPAPMEPRSALWYEGRTPAAVWESQIYDRLDVFNAESKSIVEESQAPKLFPPGGAAQRLALCPVLSLQPKR